MVRAAVTDAYFLKNSIRFLFQPFPFCIKMSAPEAEGGQDRDDILGFPGDGYQDPQDGGPLETMDEDLDSGAAGMTEESASSGPSSAKKRRKSAPVPPDEFVGDRIKQLKTTITGLKTEDNAWTQTLRDKLNPDTVKGKLGEIGTAEMLGVGHGLLLVPPPGSFLQMYAWCDVFA
jgi:hypothetical protein